MRRFELHRREDPTGISGTGVIAEGVRFSDGTVAMRWRTTTKASVFYNSMNDVIAIHGHDNKTVVSWIDELET